MYGGSNILILDGMGMFEEWKKNALQKTFHTGARKEMEEG